MNRFSSFALAALLSLLFLASCRDKTSVGPDIPSPGVYSLQLRAPDSVQYGSVYDTVVVRLFLDDAIPTGVNIHAYHESQDGEFYDNTVIAQSDTVAFPWGSNPCLRYRCQAFTVELEVITAYAILNSGDTVATATAAFTFYP